MSDLAVAHGSRAQGWIDLRERLARAAREIHFFAVASDAVNGTALLKISGNLAGLAMSIPLRPSRTAPIGLVTGDD